MEFTKICPHVGLSEWIDYYIYCQVDFSAYGDLNRHCNYLPNHKQVMMIDLDDVASLKKDNEANFVKRGHIVIPRLHLKGFSIKFKPRFHRTICVCFKPSGLYRLLGIPMSEMLNEDYSGEELIGETSKALCERLNNIFDEVELFRMLNAYFLSFIPKLKPVKLLDILIAEIERQKHKNISISDIAVQTNLSMRQLERIFLERTGVSPKLYFRIMRFSTACRLKECYPEMKWTEISHRAHYFDQTHFIRDFREFADTTPNGFLKEIESLMRFQKNLNESPFVSH